MSYGLISQKPHQPKEMLSCTDDFVGGWHSEHAVVALVAWHIPMVLAKGKDTIIPSSRTPYRVAGQHRLPGCCSPTQTGLDLTNQKEVNAGLRCIIGHCIKASDWFEVESSQE